MVRAAGIHSCHSAAGTHIGRRLGAITHRARLGAIAAIGAHLNDAYLASLPYVRLLHGKGTGALRQAIREQIRSNPLVKSFASAPPKEGGDGITVVTLNQ